MSGTASDSKRARDLRRRLVDPGDDMAELCTEAASLFGTAGFDAHVRWLDREVGGYSVETEPDSVHETLGLSEEDRLAVQVKTYRAQWGRVVEGPLPGTSFRHFFIEPVRELVAAHERVQLTTRSGQSLRLDFDVQPGRPWLPAAGEFPSEVFNWILLGLRAVLHRELGQIVS